MTTLGDSYGGHANCTLTACLDPLHPGPCKGWKGHSEEAFEKVSGRAKRGIGAYNKAKGTKGVKTASRKALLSYVNGSGPINRSLRASKGSGSNDRRIVDEIGAMDRAMRDSKLTHPITVQRAISPSAFGGKDTNVDLTGAEYTDHAFGSTGTDLSLILKHFHTTSSGKQPLIADITVPAGHGAIRVPPGQWGDEKEVLLDRGSHYRVVKDNGYIQTPKGKFRHITLEVVPGNNPAAKVMDLGDKNQTHRNTPPSVAASAMTLGQFLDPDCSFCQQTHKPGLCKGQHRGQTEPGQQDANNSNPAQRARTAVNGLTQAINQAQQIAQANMVSDPALARRARKAIADYQKALKPHQQTLKDAARTNQQQQRTAQQDARQQDTLDRAKQRQAQQQQRQHESLQKRAQGILDRRAEQKKLEKMSPKQRAAYHRTKSAQAKAKRQAAENKTLKDAGRL